MHQIPHSDIHKIFAKLKAIDVRKSSHEEHRKMGIHGCPYNMWHETTHCCPKYRKTAYNPYRQPIVLQILEGCPLRSASQVWLFAHQLQVMVSLPAKGINKQALRRRILSSGCFLWPEAHTLHRVFYHTHTS